MGCVHSVPVAREKSSKKSGKQSPKDQKTTKKKKKVTVESPKKLPVATAGKGKEANPLDFNNNDIPAGRERLPSISSSSQSLREMLPQPSTVDGGKAPLADHTPLSEGKRKNLCIWVDSIDKRSLLDPQDFAGQQRKEREINDKQQLNQHRSRKRQSILLSFATVEQSDERTNASVAVGVGGQQEGRSEAEMGS